MTDIEKWDTAAEEILRNNSELWQKLAGLIEETNNTFWEPKPPKEYIQ